MTGISPRIGMSIGIAALLGGMPQIPIISRQLGTNTERRSIREAQSRSYYGITFNYPNGPGWTVAKVKRMARKAKNRRRHKSAVAKKGGAS